jgi:hypothetical protein
MQTRHTDVFLVYIFVYDNILLINVAAFERRFPFHMYHLQEKFAKNIDLF